MKYRENPEFSWSYSRNSTFNSCARNYYYKNYAAHNGWLENAKFDAKLAYRYKNMTTLQLTFGMAVHEAIKSYISSYLKKLDPTMEAFMRHIDDAMHDVCVKSLGIQQWKDFPKQNPMLHEVLYMGGFRAKEVKRIADDVKVKRNGVERCFLHARSMKELMEGHVQRVVEIDESIKDVTKGRFYYDVDGHEVCIWAKIDLLHVRDDGKWIITDWKTERKETHIRGDAYARVFFQQVLYAKYVHDKYKVPYEDIILRRSNIVIGQENEIPVDEEKVNMCLDRVRESVRAMRAYVEDANLDVNKPKEMQVFQQAGNSPQCGVCSRCSYKHLCFGGVV